MSKMKVQDATKELSRRAAKLLGDVGSVRQAAEKTLAELSDKHTALEQNGFEFERKLNELGAKMREKMSQKELIFREYTKCENKLENLRVEYLGKKGHVAALMQNLRFAEDKKAAGQLINGIIGDKINPNIQNAQTVHDSTFIKSIGILSI